MHEIMNNGALKIADRVAALDSHAIAFAIQPSTFTLNT